MNAHRVNIIGLLQLIANEDEQNKYQWEVPFVSVPNEMCCQWFDDFYHPDFNEFRAQFSQEELHSFKEFNALFEKYVKRLPETLIELHGCPEWKLITDKANKILDSHGWRNIKVEYDAE